MGVGDRLLIGVASRCLPDMPRMLFEAPISRLEDFLAAEYPKLRCYAGVTPFAAMVRRFAHRHPARPLRWYAVHFPRSIERFELAEMAGLELALSDANHAPDYPSVTFADLDAAGARLAQASFDIHPSARRVTVTTNVAGVWASLRCDQPPPVFYRRERPQDILVWRQGHSARFRLLGEEESRVYEKVRAGLTFGGVVDFLAEQDDPVSAKERAVIYLRGWIEAETISSFRFAAAAGEK